MMETEKAPPLHSIAHVALTVVDPARSQTWYEGVMGLEYVMTVPHEGGEGIVLADPDRRVWWAIHRHDGQDGERFSEKRTGLDHVGLLVDSTESLAAWSQWLDAHGVEHHGIADLPDFGMQALVFRDPDGTPLELLAYI
jgi:glyoxylase I family protein